MRPSLPVALACLALAACAGTPAYGPAERSGLGYSDQIIETGRYRVTYGARDVGAAQNGALRRAAELATEQGFDWFTVVSRDTARERRGGGSSVGLGGGSGRGGVGVGVGVNIPLTNGTELVTTRLEVVMGRGEKPSGPQSYGARDILANLGTG